MLNKYMNKKVIILIIALVLSAFTLTACQQQAVTEEPEIIATPLTLGYIPISSSPRSMSPLKRVISSMRAST